MRGLETDLQAEAIDVLLLNIHDAVGSEMAARLDFQFSPTYLVFDAAGAEVWRSNSTPDAATVRAALP